jgi:hypothetical protein
MTKLLTISHSPTLLPSTRKRLISPPLLTLECVDTEDDKSSSIDFKMFDIEDFNASDSDDLQYLTPRMISHPLLTLKCLT